MDRADSRVFVEKIGTDLTRRSGWHILTQFVAERRYLYVASVLCLIVSSILAAVIPQIVGQFADVHASGALTLRSALHFGWLVFVVGAFRVVLGWLGRLSVAQAARVLTFRIREALFKKWETLTPAYFHSHSTGELLSHALSDVDVVRQLAAMGITTAISGVFMLSSSVYFMVFRMHWRLALAGLVPLLLIPVLIRYFGPRIKTQSGQYQGAVGVMSQAVEEIVGGVRAVKAFGNEKIVLDRFKTRVDALVEQKMKFVRLSTIFGALVPFVSALGFVGVIWYGGYLTINHTISLGTFVAFLLYLTLLKQPLEQLGNMLNTVQRASASLGRISLLLDAVPDTVDRVGARAEQPAVGEIEFRDVSYRYPGACASALSGISFSIRRGETLGVVGAIGSGKSTLAHLLLRLYEPAPQSIFVDGVDVLDYSLVALRSAIAYVPQNSFLFSSTIKENIAFSDFADPEPDRVVAAAKVAAIHEDISTFSNAYDTEIGERGVRLSGGQKQRVSIARMVYKQAPIRVLDDSLSAVDTKTERRILGNFASQKSTDFKDRGATIIIAHRLSAVMNADEIIFLEEGRVVERGSHAQLINLDGKYAQLWRMQLGELGKSDAGTADDGVGGALREILRNEDEALSDEMDESE